MVLIRKKTETGWWQGELSGGVSTELGPPMRQTSSEFKFLKIFML